MRCSICNEELVENKLSVSGYVHKPNSFRPLIEEVVKRCYGSPVPKYTYEELEDKLADAHSLIIRLSHCIRDFEEGSIDAYIE